MFSSNQILKISGEDKKVLKQSLKFIIKQSEVESVSGFLSDETSFSILLGGYTDSKFLRYPMKTTPAILAEQIQGWLDTEAEYGLFEQFGYEDGGMNKGWLIEIENSTVNGTIKIYPHWCYYSK